MANTPRSSEQARDHKPLEGTGFNDLDTLRNADGLVAFISQRKSNGSITIAVMKEFERDGSMHRTQFISELMFDSYLDMVKLAITRARELRDKGLVPTKAP